MPRNQQVGVHSCQIAQLERVVAGHRVTPFESLSARQVGDAACQDVEIDTTVVVIGEECIVECHGLACQTLVRWLFKGSVKDQVSQNSLFLLPPCLAIMPHETVPLLIVTPATFHNIIPACTLCIHANRRHDLSNLFGQVGILFTWSQVMNAHQVPGNLEVVTDNGTVLLPAPGGILAPILVIPFLHEGAMLVVREMLCDGIGSGDQEVSVLVLASCQP